MNMIFPGIEICIPLAYRQIDNEPYHITGLTPKRAPLAPRKFMTYPLAIASVVFRAKNKFEDTLAGFSHNIKRELLGLPLNKSIAEKQ